jgi:phenylpropionate dioxygenase-like ring-hydroxylating dioxygenase large terminal subunit
MMAPYEAMIEPYRFEQLKALGRVTLRPRAVNWKNIGDNYSDGLHIPVAHPASPACSARATASRPRSTSTACGATCSTAPRPTGPSAPTRACCPAVPHLPEASQRHWLYFKLWPNVAFDIYPDQVDFMQWLPVSPTESLHPRDQLRASTTTAAR